MLFRVLLRLTIAIGLILQGGMGATAAYASGGYHCAMAGHHGGTHKCPCCPAKSIADCADACMVIAALPAATIAITPSLAPAPPAFERPGFVAVSIDRPLRPPIA